eukprot:9503831-Pyramimonas_sp.AAC.5
MPAADTRRRGEGATAGAAPLAAQAANAAVLSVGGAGAGTLVSPRSSRKRACTTLVSHAWSRFGSAWFVLQAVYSGVSREGCGVMP